MCDHLLTHFCLSLQKDDWKERKERKGRWSTTKHDLIQDSNIIINHKRLKSKTDFFVCTFLKEKKNESKSSCQQKWTLSLYLIKSYVQQLIS